MERLFTELSLLVLIATALAILLHSVRQPVIIAYLAAGVLAGPAALNLISSPELVRSLASFGITLLLFLVGLELKLSKLKLVGKQALTIATGQIIAAVSLVYLISRASGIGSTAAWYLGLALACSSTIIVVKLLTERAELDSLAGRLTITMLLAQDAIAIAALIMLSTSSTAAQLPTTLIGLAIIKGLTLLAAVWLTTRFILPRLFNMIARSPEVLFLAAVSWCLLVALATGALGLSIEIGAFVAGLSLGTLPYQLEISARIKSLRDFFVTLFFVTLGSQLSFGSLGTLQPLFWGLTAYVLIGNPLVVMLLMSWLGFRKRTSFQVALSMGMVSEFSLILMSLGLRLGQVTPAEASLVGAVCAITITITSYALARVDALYVWLTPILSWFERSHPAQENTSLPLALSGHAVVVGCDRLGSRLLETLNSLKFITLAIDFNPQVIHRLTQGGQLCMYGALEDLDILEHARLKQARLIISTIPGLSDNLLLLHNVKQSGIKVPVFVTATNWHDTQELYQAGADYVIFPHYLSAEHVSLMLRERLLEPNRALVDKAKHMQELEQHYANT